MDNELLHNQFTRLIKYTELFAELKKAVEDLRTAKLNLDYYNNLKLEVIDLQAQLLILELEILKDQKNKE